MENVQEKFVTELVREVEGLIIHKHTALSLKTGRPYSYLTISVLNPDGSCLEICRYYLNGASESLYEAMLRVGTIVEKE